MLDINMMFKKILSQVKIMNGMRMMIMMKMKKQTNIYDIHN